MDESLGTLFGADTDWENNACLHWGADEWDLYMTGYDRAAELLALHVQTENRDQDVLIYPIVFLSRHYLELRLKRTLLDAQDLLDLPQRMPTHHNLASIWDEVRPLVLEIFAGDDPTDLAQLDTVIRELGSLDRASFAFRYPTDKSGAHSLPEDLRRVNIRRFAETFRKGVRMLESIHGGIGDYCDLRGER